NLVQLRLDLHLKSLDQLPVGLHKRPLRLNGSNDFALNDKRRQRNLDHPEYFNINVFLRRLGSEITQFFFLVAHHEFEKLNFDPLIWNQSDNRIRKTSWIGK